MLSLNTPLAGGTVAAIDGAQNAYCAGFQALLAQQRLEIAALEETFDFAVFAGVVGPLSGQGCLPTVH